MYRIRELLQFGRKLYHTNDLAVLWGMKNRQTLYMTITRYIDAGVLYPVYRGLYATVPIAALDPLELGVAIIHRYTYLTTESVLANAGAISQVVYDTTFASDQSKRVKVDQWSFRYRKLKDEYLYHPAGVTNREGVLTASTERAAADLLYFNPKAYFDIPELIDFDQVRAIQREIGYA